MVKVYSTSTCPWCDKVKEYLNSKGISYVNYNVQEDLEKAKEMIEKSGQRGVPVLDIEGNIIIGFDKSRIDSLLNINIH